jgi:CRISPR-associated protein Cas2
MHYIAVYDISNDKRRERVRKLFLSYGHPVQESVFEFDLSVNRLEILIRASRKVITQKDDLRIYQVCKACSQNVRVFGGKPLAKAEPFYII